MKKPTRRKLPAQRKFPGERNVQATAKCASFDIAISAAFVPHGLSGEQIDDIQRKLRQSLANAVARLPFAHVYPCEVKLQ